MSKPQIGLEKDPQWLAGLLSRTALHYFDNSARATEHREAGRDICPNVTRHKKDLLEFGESATLLRASGCDCIAFLVEVVSGFDLNRGCFCQEVL